MRSSRSRSAGFACRSLGPGWSWSVVDSENGEFWREVLLELALSDRSDTFRSIVRELTGHREEGYLVAWRELCDRASPARAQAMFEVLLMWTVRETSAPLKEHWKLLVSSPGAATLRDDWAREAARLVPGITWSKNLALLKPLPEVLKYLPLQPPLNEVTEIAKRQWDEVDDHYALPDWTELALGIGEG